LARRWGHGEILVKDESMRFGLKAFKVLGGSGLLDGPGRSLQACSAAGKRIVKIVGYRFVAERRVVIYPRLSITSQTVCDEAQVIPIFSNAATSDGVIPDRASVTAVMRKSRSLA
jgi:hypothetical protein